MNDYSSTRLCMRCKAIEFNEHKYGAIPVLSRHGYRLDVRATAENVDVREGYNTGTGDFLDLSVLRMMEEYPQLPQISQTAATCDFCRFLKQCLLSKDVTLAIADQGCNIEEKSCRIGLQVSYSWTRGNTKAEMAARLEGLYIYVLYCDNDHSDSTHWGPRLGRDPLCVIKCSVSDLPGLSMRHQLRQKHETHKITADSVFGSRASCTEWLGLRKSFSYDTYSQEAVPWMRRRLQECETGSGGCGECSKLQTDWESTRPTRAHKRWMPTRLLDVLNDTVKLISTQSHFKIGQEASKYTALSYCWGLRKDAESQLTTTVSTKSARKCGISFESLSPVQKDAVKVTRAMGIQYLWIDSLCIVQKDAKDWEKESVQMGHIYSYATFTIVSVMPTNQSSFLSPQLPEVTVRFKTSFPVESGFTTSCSYIIHFSSVETHASGTQRTTKLSPHLAPNRWVTRGWTLQEQALSRRLFLFGPEGVRFICQSGEQAPVAETSIPTEPQAPRSIICTIQELQVGTARDNDGYERWRDFARDFSGRSCTKRSDRLPAMSGLAKLLGNSLSGENKYTVGLWRGDLIKTLLWRHLSPEPRYESLEELITYLRSTEERVAPSWSWIDRFGITFLCYDDAIDDWGDWVQEFELVDEDVFTNDYGVSLNAGSVVLRVKARTFGSLELLKESGMAPRGRREQLPFNHLLLDIRGAQFHCMMDWSTADVDGLRENVRDGLGNIRFALIASAPLGDGKRGKKAAIGLILYPAEGPGKSEESMFYRIGAFYSLPMRGGENSLSAFEGVKDVLCIL